VSAPGPAWRATYRIQLSAATTFADVEALVPYLVELGISHLYLSPVLEAVAGSTHGYDGTDPTAVSAERGGEGALRQLADVAHQHGLGLLVDLVPNHLAASEETPWWNDPVERARIFDVDDDAGWYRRFFDIDGLAGVRQEDPEVFDRTHAKVLELVRDGVVDGLRIDHPDGLTDPAGYLHRLAEVSGVPIWVEKILHVGETLRPWPVEGTVGYEFAAELGALFSDPDGEAPLTALYRDLTGDHEPFDEVASAAKREQLGGPFHRELERLVALAPDLDPGSVADTVVGLPAYRTYVEPISGQVDPADRQLLDAAGASPELARRLLLDESAPAELVTRFQQLTAPVTAKAVEDTAFYRSVRLLAHNEVGNDPARFSMSVDAFHEACARRADRHPRMLLAGTTHDTKRSADTRARLLALTGIPEAFELHVRRWFAVTDDLVGDPGPTDRERWFLFQTLLGSWPLTFDRLEAYLLKAIREAGLTTDWVRGDERHEVALVEFARQLFEVPAFWADFVPFAQRVARLGERTSVAQVLLRATTPGVCDVYQGDETWFLSLVDPDVRRPTDRAARRRQLDAVRTGAPPTRATAKLHVLHRALDARRRRPATFAGSYRALPAGRATVAFTRGDDDVVVVVPVRRDPDAHLEAPTGRWRDLLDDREIELDGRTPVRDLIGPLGCGFWERLPGDR
jgi:(1->4)-alpha-D-glucan 1-alpha-D-glucosylmutase